MRFVAHLAVALLTGLRLQSCTSEVCPFLAVWRPGLGQYLGPRPALTWMAVFPDGRVGGAEDRRYASPSRCEPGTSLTPPKSLLLTLLG